MLKLQKSRLMLMVVFSMSALFLGSLSGSGHPDVGAFHHIGDFTVNGAVGIGKAPNPGVQLHVFQPREGDAVAQIQSDVTGGNALLRINKGGSTPWYLGYVEEDFQISKGNFGKPAITIKNNDEKIGFWTDDPQSELQISGYVQLALTEGSPPETDCNEPGQEAGRMKVDAVNGLLWICTNSGWVSK